MTTVSGTFTAKGVSSVLRLGAVPEDIAYTLTGPVDAQVQLEHATTPDQTAWEPVVVLKRGQVTLTGNIRVNAKDTFRVRALTMPTVPMVTNGDFASATGWTVAGAWSIGSGVATRTASASNVNMSTTIAAGLVAGATYRLGFDVTTSAGSLTVDLGGGTASAAISDASATVSVDLVAGSSNAVLRFIAAADYAGTIDNVTLTPVVTYSFNDGDAVIRELKDADGTVYETVKQSGHTIHKALTVEGALTASAGLTGAVTGAINGVPVAETATVDPSQKFTLFEDFYGTWAIGDAGPADTWSTTAGAGTGNAGAVTVAASINGEVTIKSASDDGTHAQNCSTFTAINLGFKANQGGLVLEARLKISDISEAVLFVGFTDTISTTVELPIFLVAADIDSDATDACGVGYDVDGTTKQFFHGGVKNGTDTTPAYSGTAPVDNTYFTVRVEVSAAGAVTGYIDGTAIGTAVADAVTATTALTPAIVIGNRSANQVVATIDYIWVQQNR